MDDNKPWAPKKPSSPLLKPALELARQDVPIFPCSPRSKAPYTPHGFKNASTDEDTIKAWWARWPNAWIGMPTGSASGFVVIDLDRKENQADGTIEWPKFVAEHGGSTDLQTLTVQTPSGGQHFIFKLTEGQAVRNIPLHKLWPGVEIKGDGGYIIVSPSPGYTVLNNVEPLLVPSWLLLAMAAYQRPVRKLNGHGGEPILAELEELVAAMAVLPNDDVVWDDWNRIGMALYRGCGGSKEGFKLFDEWSKKSQKYNARTTQQKWNVLGRSPPTELNAATIFYEAQQHDPLWRHALNSPQDDELGQRLANQILEKHSPKMPARLLEIPGLVGDIAKHILDSSIYPQPLLALGAALALVGTIAGRYFMGPTRSGTHLYIVCIAPTGVGKDHPLKACGVILEASGLLSLLGPSQFMSMPAVINFLKESPLSLCAIDEFGAFLKRINSKHASGFEGAVSSILRMAWGSSFTLLKTPEWAAVRSENIHAPSMGVFGNATPKEFFFSLQDSDIENGLLNRFFILEGEEWPEQRDPLVDLAKVPKSISDAMRRIFSKRGGAMSGSSKFNPLIGENYCQLDISPQAKSRWDAFAKKLNQRRRSNEAEDPFLVRTAEMAMRLATIVTVGMEVDCIEDDIMTWAIDFAQHSVNVLMRLAAAHMADTDTQAIGNEILRIIRKKSNGSKQVRRVDVLQSLKYKYKRRELIEVFESLVEAEFLSVRKIVPKNGGAPTYWYAALKK